MNHFILKLFFSGLIVFVPSEDRTEVTVLLLNTNQAHHLSDGSRLPHHASVLIARAGDCAGDCPKRDLDIANVIYRDLTSESARLDAIEQAVVGGGAWLLSNSDLAISKVGASSPDLEGLTIVTGARGVSNGEPLPIPTTSAERTDFSWIPNIKEICSSCTLDASVLGNNPPAGRIAARLRLRNGTVATHSIARIGSNVTPVRFERLDGTGSASSYMQAVASFVSATIEVTGDSIEFAETKFDGSAGRSMTLEPDEEGIIEVAVLNTAPFTPPASQYNHAPQAGKHFEMFYDVMETPPAPETRLIPRAANPSGTPSYPTVSWTSIHPENEVFSVLLNKLRLDVNRGPYDRLLCPPTQDPLP